MAMALPQVKQCCCGCTLETGTLIIAWMEIVFSILYIISNIATLAFGFDETLNNNTVTPITPEPKEDPSRTTGFLITYIILGVIQLALGIVLLIGTKRRLPNYLNIYVIIGIIGLCVYVPLIIVQSVLLLIVGLIAAGIMVFIFQAAVLALSFYLLVVISSFRKEILSEIRGVV